MRCRTQGWTGVDDGGVARSARPRRAWWAVLVSSSMVALLLSACGSVASPKQGSKSSSMPGPTLSAKFGDLQNIGTPTTDSAEQFAKLVKRYTDAKITITVYPNSELGSPAQQLAGTQAGTIAFYATPDVSAAVPQTDALALPYLFPSAAVASKVINGPAMRAKLWSLFPAAGLKFIGSWAIGYTSLLTASRKITSPADVAGLKIRLYNPTVSPLVMSSLGADGVVIASTQVVTALSTGVVNGADDPASTMVGSDWYSGMHYLALTDLAYVPSPTFASLKFWKSMSTAEQKAVSKAFQATIASNLSAANTLNATAIATMKNVLTVTSPPLGPFKAAVQSVYKKVETLYPDGIVQALETAVKAAQ